MNYVRLTEMKISKKGNRVDYYFDASENFKKFILDINDNPFVEYPEGYNLNEIPKGILAIPFVSNVMLICAMLDDFIIEVDELSKEFYDSLTDIQSSYLRMYPYMKFNIKVNAKSITEDKCVVYDNKCSLFFTGGVDATSALIEVTDKKPLIINIVGGDVSINDVDTHNCLDDYFNRLSTQFGLEYMFITSNFRYFYNEKPLDELCMARLKQKHYHNWWGNISHICSMSSLIAPVVWKNGISTHYIASSYEKDNEVFDANNEDLVSSIKLPYCNLVSVDAELNRMQKMKKIVEYTEKQNAHFELKVCWRRKKGENCSSCEKCYRTILEILANGGDPNDYGFNVNNKTYEDMHNWCDSKHVDVGFWNDIQKVFQSKSEYWQTKSEISWILTQKFNNRSKLKKFLHSCRVLLFKLKY